MDYHLDLVLVFCSYTKTTITSSCFTLLPWPNNQKVAHYHGEVVSNVPSTDNDTMNPNQQIPHATIIDIASLPQSQLL